eukprot:gene11479-biopygen8332
MFRNPPVDLRSEFAEVNRGFGQVAQGLDFFRERMDAQDEAVKEIAEAQSFAVEELGALGAWVADLAEKVDRLSSHENRVVVNVTGHEARAKDEATFFEPATRQATAAATQTDEPTPLKVEVRKPQEVILTAVPPPTTEKKNVLCGGEFVEGKMTDNVELDAIYQKYLPAGKALPCATLPTLTEQRVEAIQKMLEKKRRLYFPLFVRHHWIAGILRMNKKGKALLETFDSAPSYVVQKDLREQLKPLWPDLVIHEGPSPRQNPGSNDCGLFMTAAFFGNYLDAYVTSPSTIGSRLRRLLARAGETDMDRSSFLRSMEEELLRRCEKLEGGGPRKSQRSSECPSWSSARGRPTPHAAFGEPGGNSR